MPRTAAPAMIGETPTMGARPAGDDEPALSTASCMPGMLRIVPIDTTGFDGATSTTSAAANAASAPGEGRAAARFCCSNRAAGQGSAMARPPLLKVHAVAGRRHDVRVDLVVGRRVQGDPERPALLQLRRHLRGGQS